MCTDLFINYFLYIRINSIFILVYSQTRKISDLTRFDLLIKFMGGIDMTKNEEEKVLKSESIKKPIKKIIENTKSKKTSVKNFNNKKLYHRYSLS